jgi:hypothetical protein
LADEGLAEDMPLIHSERRDPVPEESFATVTLHDQELRRAMKVPRVDHGVAVRRSFALARRVRSLGDVPLVVITAGQPGDSNGIPPDVRRRLGATWLSL